MRIYLYYLLYCMCFYFNQKFQALRTNESLTRNTNINIINLYKIIIFIILLLQYSEIVKQLYQKKQ